MAREKLTDRLNWWYVAYCVLGVLIVAVVVLNFVLHRAGFEGGPTTGNPSTQSATPNPTEAPPIPTGQPEGMGEEAETPLIPAFDCRNFMTQSEYEAFIDRLYDFEDIFRMPESSNKLDLMTPFVTNIYLDSRKGAPDESDTNVIVTVDRGASTATCQQDRDDLITAKVVPIISVYRESDGELTLINGPLVLQSHYTSWVWLNDAWFVNKSQ